MSFPGRWLQLFLIGCVLCAFPVARAAQNIEVNARGADGLLSYDEKTGIVTVTNGFVARYTNAVLMAERGQINITSGDATAEGNVTLQQDQLLWRGEKLSYNFLTRSMSTDKFRVGQPPVFVSAAGLTGAKTNNTYSATNAVLTTDDVAEPFYRIRASRITLIPGHSIEAHNAILYLGDVPVFYYPFYRRSFVRHPNNFVFTPGYRSLFGLYLLGEYNQIWNDHFDSTLHFDYRTRRGIAGGPDLNWDFGKFGEGHVWAYFAHDEDAGITTTNGIPIRNDRFRISFDHQANINTNLDLRFVVREQSDSLVIRDFFEGEYRRNIQPISFFEINQRWQNFSLDLLVQPQINDFFQTVERLPDIRLSGLRQQIGESPFYYDSETSLDYLRVRSRIPGVANFAAGRADTYQQVLLPTTAFGWLNLAPRVGGRFTYYGEGDTTGAPPTAEAARWVFNTGMEASFKTSRVWPNMESKLLDVHGLRHVFEPSLNYAYVPSPNKAPAQLPQFDSELPSLRLLPIEYPDYNAIDSIDSQNVLRFGIRNRFQTHREGATENLLNWAVYGDWRLKPRAGQTTFSDVFSDLDFSPRSWIIFNSLTRYDISTSRWREAYHSITLSPNDKWSWAISHRYLRDDPAFGPVSGANTIASRIYIKINENWGMRISHHFEARDGHMEEQAYTLYRDLRSWTSAINFKIRESRLGVTDYAVSVQFSLKAFPRFKRGSDSVHSEFLIGG